jgi:hypothetical protein
MIASRTCSNCKRDLPATDLYFYKRKTAKFGLDTYCKVCRKAMTKRAYYGKREEIPPEEKKAAKKVPFDVMAFEDRKKRLSHHTASMDRPVGTVE